MVLRVLDVVEARVAGSLLEKQQATPEYYPLTLNALVAACNQKSNREPVVTLSEAEIESALSRLQDDRLAWRIVGGRATRWEHNVETAWQLDRPSKAVITMLLLRGPQTPGELRGRSDRLHHFEAIEEVDMVLRGMAEREEPLVAELPRRPGQKESRWRQLVAEEPDASPATGERPQVHAESINARLDRLEARAGELGAELDRLKRLLGE
ncbi:MAG TPA: YceH family protein [Thermoanaerobaculia bacterium]|nr:YceH family protein [Thermoanaerobaculia bacterium]